MNVHALLPTIAAAVYLLTAVVIYAWKKPNPVNKSFSAMLLCISFWNVEVAGIIAAPDAQFARFWGDIFRPSLLFIPPTFLHFAVLFTRAEGISSRIRIILWSAYTFSCFLTVLNWTTDFAGPVIAYSWGYHIQSGPFYPLFMLHFFFCIISGFYLLVRGYLFSDRYQRHRLKYFFLALAISFILGTLNFLPMFGVAIYPVTPLVITVGLLIAAYSVVQNRLMDVSVFLARSLTYILSTAILTVPAFLIMLLLERNYFQKVDLYFSFLLLLIGVGGALAFEKIKSRIDRAMHQILVRDKYLYHEILRDFSRRLVTMVDLNRLLHTLAETVEKSMGVNRISIFLHSAEKENFPLALVRGESGEDLQEVSFGPDHPLIKYLQEKKEAVLRAELQRLPPATVEEKLLETMRKIGAEVSLPLIYMNRLSGLINLGNKKGGEMYYREDLDLLNSLASQVAIAVENASLYESLKKSQGIMRRADRLASLGTLIASLAHEIRNPLVSIKTFTQLLPERMEDEEFRSYFLKIASGEIDRLTSLINELLGFARPSEPNLQGENVNELIDKMGFLIATEARKKNIAVRKELASDLPLIMVDAEQIKQVLLNVLLNAVQAIPGEGEIRIRTRTVQVPLEEGSEGFVQIEVQDTGIGIPRDNLERVFDPFFSTRPDGSGLGMAISHQIIHEHGGFIDLESELGKGTVFRIHLPLRRGGGLVAGV